MDDKSSRFDPGRPDLVVGVVGAGAMGRGIVQVAALGGLAVVVYDAVPGAAEAARSHVRDMIGRLVEKLALSPEQADAAVSRITVASALSDVSGAHVVVEAIVENLDAKKALLRELEKCVAPDAILASNTSSLPITAIAAAVARPERVAGLHFFNPVPLMKLVEVVPGLRTGPWVTDALLTIARRMTREPIVCTDSPGFVVNHIGRAYVPEAARILSEGIASPAEIDAIMTGVGFRMGPFALLDLIGADVSVAVMESLLAQYYGEPMYAPQPALRLRVDGGLYGRKSGAGWYAYQVGKPITPALPPAPAPRPAKFWIAGRDGKRAEVSNVLEASGMEVVAAATSADVHVLCLEGPSLVDGLEESGAVPERTIAVDTLFGLSGVRTLMTSPATSPEARVMAHAAFGADGTQVVVVNDSPGFVAPRLVAHIVNVACQIAQRGIASPGDIDKGARLGLGYPSGPLAWGDEIGPARVLAILEHLHRFYGEPRYRPSPWLVRRARLGLSLSAPERRT